MSRNNLGFFIGESINSHFRVFLVTLALVGALAAAGCRDPTYTIGGVVSGLSGTLVLQNNGGDDKTIRADGPFNFTTALANGAAYAVTVLTQPIGQTCTVANGSGSVNLANVTDVNVTCAAT